MNLGKYEDRLRKIEENMSHEEVPIQDPPYGLKNYPQHCLRVISWIREAGSNLRTLRGMYDQISNGMAKDTQWTTETMAEVAYTMSLIAEKLVGMALRAKKTADLLGEVHGYKISMRATIYQTLAEAKRATEDQEIDWKAITDLEVASGEERVEGGRK